MNTEEFEAGDVDDYTDCDGNHWWEAGIHHLTHDAYPINGPDLWLQRIVIYGETEEQARALRDRILESLKK